jgi:hypothetical protein
MREHYGIPEDPSLRTHSSLRAWWLQRIWGYRLIEVRKKPRVGRFRRIRYESSYVLLPKSPPR